jgi:hypothetical protein
MTGLDNVGLPVYHSVYAKRSCNKCYGRGWTKYIKPVEATVPCVCTHRKYSNIRVEMETLRNELKNNGTPEKEALEQALKTTKEKYKIE